MVCVAITWSIVLYADYVVVVRLHCSVVVMVSCTTCTNCVCARCVCLLCRHSSGLCDLAMAFH